MISESTIDKVRELPIETVVGQYVKLAKDGRTSMKGLCPFHSENTPSFSINLNKNLYHCFGCNRGGDGISFIMEKENLNFQQAVRLLAKKFNILMEDEYDEERTDADKAKQAHKDSLYAILEKVQTFLQTICACPPMTTAAMPGNMPTTDGRRTSVQKRVSVMRPGKAMRSWSIAVSRH